MQLTFKSHIKCCIWTILTKFVKMQYSAKKRLIYPFLGLFLSEKVHQTFMNLNETLYFGTY